MTRFTLCFALLTAACGGSSSTPDTTPTSEAPVATPVEPADDGDSTPTAGDDGTSAAAGSAAPAGPDPATVKAGLLAAELAAYERAKPVFDKWCARCHAQGGKSANAEKREHFDMTTYPFGGEHADEIGEEIREVLGLDDDKPSMPPDKKGAVKGAELALIKAWSEAFDASVSGGARP